MQNYKLVCFNFYLNSMVLHPVARVSQKFVELHHTQLLFIVFHSFILILIIRHVSAHFLIFMFIVRRERFLAEHQHKMLLRY
jgi:hypothetical protein